MDIISYRPALWLLVLVPLGVFYARTLVERRRLLKVSSFALRCLGIALLVLSLCRPFVSLRSDRAHIICLVDVSQSVDVRGVRNALSVIRRRVDELETSDSWSMYSFAAEIRKTTPDEMEQQLTTWEEQVSDDLFRRESRIADALKAARLSFPAGKAKRIVLFTDGRETRGEFDEAIDVLDAENIDVLVSDIRGIGEPEAGVASLRSNTPSAYFAERVQLTASIFSNREMSGRIRFLNRGVIEADIPIRLKPGNATRFPVSLTMNTTGSSVWTAELVPEKDHFTVNNTASCTIDVKGRANVLVLHEKPAQMRAFRKALGKQGIDLDVRGKHGLPESLAGILEFDAVVIANFPATAMTTRQMLNLKSYVSDFGGGLVMLGSENSFGLGGYYKTPVEEVLPLVSRYEKEKEKPSLAMVLVIDKSGSMMGLPIALARQAAKASVELLSPRDQIAVVAFDGSPYVVVEMTTVVDAFSVSASIDRVDAGGGTNMHPAMFKGMQLLRSASAKIKHMIILSDGMSMPGDFIGLAAAMAEENMTVTTVALGPSADRGLMKSIADTGKGRYYETLDPDTVPRIFTKETVEASRSAIHEEPFAPVQVGEADMLEGIDMERAPFLLGYVMNRPKPTAKVLLLTESGDPLLAVGRFGLGVTLGFASDVSDRWAGEWLHWPQFGKFWAQALRSCLRKTNDDGIIVTRREEPEATRYLVESRDRAGRPINGVAWNTVLLDENGARQTVPTAQTGMGRYEAIVPHGQTGSHTLRFYDPDSGKAKVVHRHEDYPPEYRLSTHRDKGFLTLPRLTDTSLRAALAPARTKRPIQDHVLITGILCLIGSVLLRRI